jgi:hypothetical protein
LRQRCAVLYAGALISLAVIYQSGDAEGGLYWFALYAALRYAAPLRGALAVLKSETPDALNHARIWARLMVGVNFFFSVGNFNGVCWVPYFFRIARYLS